MAAIETDQRGLSRNTQRLLRGLGARGVVPHGASFHIVRNRGATCE